MKHQPLEVENSGGDLLKPADLYAAMVHTYGGKCRSSGVSTLFGGIMGGVLIGLAGLFYVIVMTDNNLSGGIAKLIGGVCFSLGLVMISITGSELFTGNIMALLPRAYRMISNLEIIRNWSAVYASNFLGSLAIGLAAATAGLIGGPAAESLHALVTAKLAQTPVSTFIEGVLANFMVCLAIWMGLATRSPTGRILCIAGPITAFVAMGLEHSIANMFFFSGTVFSGGGHLVPQMIQSLAIVTVGNIVGAVLLCVFMGFAYRHSQPAKRILPLPAADPSKF